MQRIQRLLLLLLLIISTSPAKSQSGLKLWYDELAADWNQALPIGNGRLGAMVFGGIERERLQLNEETVWSHQGAYEDLQGGARYLPQIRQLLFDGEYVRAQQLADEKLMAARLPSGTNAYQTLGDIRIDFQKLRDVREYRRELLLDSALVRVSYRSGDVQYRRAYFSSAPDQALIAYFEANQPGKISFSLEMDRPDSTERIDWVARKRTLFMTDHVASGKGVRLETRLKIEHQGGSMIYTNGRVIVAGADRVLLRLTAATDFWGEDPTDACSNYGQLGELKNFEQLLADHVQDYQQFYNRVRLELGASEAQQLSTDQRLEALAKGAEDPALAALYFQFGRYLLISSSRPGGMPANLQGIWNEHLIPPWNADYHININIQMNYWPAEVTNLSELHEPFLTFIGKLRENGRETARILYGAHGFTAHHTTDAWHYTTSFGKPQYGMWPMGAAWAATHLWLHYLYTEDQDFLAKYGYPVMKEAAVFLSDFLIEHPRTGLLVTGPSMSPENNFITPDGQRSAVVMGPAMDQQIVWHLFTSVLAAAEVLDIEDTFTAKIASQLDRLTPSKIGADGRILEWSEEGLTEAEPGHRHISHLYGLFPSPQFNWADTPEFMRAAERVLEERLSHGGGHTGWSRAWIINFYARLKKPEKAHENLRALFVKSTHPNLFDNHPPFQIDGNFGGTAGIAEMLLQSHAGYIEVLPALPPAWPDGKVEGLRAIGGFEIDIAWEDGELTEVRVRSDLGNECRLKYGDKEVSFETEPGGEYLLNSRLER